MVKLNGNEKGTLSDCMPCNIPTLMIKREQTENKTKF